MPLAFTQEDFLVKKIFMSFGDYEQDTNRKSGNGIPSYATMHAFSSQMTNKQTNLLF